MAQVQTELRLHPSIPVLALVAVVVFVVCQAVYYRFDIATLAESGILVYTILALVVVSFLFALSKYGNNWRQWYRDRFR